MTRKVQLVWILLLAPLACAPGRVADLKDSGRLSVGVGIGLTVDARVGALTHPSLGFVSSAAMIGFDSRDVEGPWYEARTSDPFALYWFRREQKPWSWALGYSGWRGTFESVGYFDAVDELDEPIDQEGLPETGTQVRGELLVGRIETTRWVPWRMDGDPTPGPWRFRDLTDFQVGAHALLINVRAGLNPLELIDFLLGFGGLDIAGDDPQPE